MTENAIAKDIVDAAYRIHTKLGPGLLESVYETILAWELEQKGHKVQRQHPVPLTYETLHFDAAFRADLLIGNQVIIELKATEGLTPNHKKQLLTYLRLSEKRLGLLISFNETLIRNGIHRIVNGLPDAPEGPKQTKAPHTPQTP